MSRIRLLLAAAGVALVAAAPTTAGPTMSPTKLRATVGPGFTITLKKGGVSVRTLKAGRYTITVTDRSDFHSFHLKGPGFNRTVTPVGFTGTKTVTVNLRRGKYDYFCDPHRSTMKGAFRVT